MSSVPRYAKSLPDTARGLTSDLWQNSLDKYVSEDPAFGVRFKDDFVDRLVGLTGTTSATVDRKWSVADAAAAGGTYSFANVSGPDGVGRLNSTGTTNHFGAEAQGPAVVTLPTHATAASQRGRVVAEVRVNKSDADTIFVGLSEAGDNFLDSSSALPVDQDYIGFYTTDAGATWTFVCANDNAGGTAATDSFTIPASIVQATGYQKLGFAVNRDSSVEVVVNGQYFGKIANGISSLALPIEDLVPRLSVTAGGGTTAPTIDVSDVDVYVESSP